MLNIRKKYEGRTKIVTAVCIDLKGEKHSWQLSRGQFYTEGYIRQENFLQAKRYKPLQTHFTEITKVGGALRASNSLTVKKYLEGYAQFEEMWWSEIALKRNESRSKMQRYIGKKKVMDKFFSKLYTSAKKICGPNQHIEIAYGHAGMTFSSSGKREVAVPTKGTAKICKNIFRSTNFVFVNEYNTSKICWETGLPYEKVYKRYEHEKEYLCHTSAHYMSFVEEDKVNKIKEIQQNNFQKAIRRKGGTIFPNNETIKKLRYNECRGLRFCPERCMYYDRDGASARAIAGLRCLELKGFGRPAVFSSKKT